MKERFIPIGTLKFKKFKKLVLESNILSDFFEFIPRNFIGVISSEDEDINFVELMAFIKNNNNVDIVDHLSKSKEDLTLLHSLFVKYDSCNSLLVDLVENKIFINSDILSHFVRGVY